MTAKEINDAAREVLAYWLKLEERWEFDAFAEYLTSKVISLDNDFESLYRRSKRLVGGLTKEEIKAAQAVVDQRDVALLALYVFSWSPLGFYHLRQCVSNEATTIH